MSSTSNIIEQSTSLRRLARARPNYKLVLVLLLVLTGVGLGAATLILTSTSHTTLVKIIRFDSAATDAVVSPDGQMLASVDTSDKAIGTSRIYIWHTNDGGMICSTRLSGVYSMAFSPDGGTLAASGNDGIRLFRTTDGKLLRTFEGNQLFSVAISPDGQAIASAGAEHQIRIWRLKDGSLLQTYAVDRWITSLVFSPDGNTLAAGSAANTGVVRPEDASTEENPILIFQVHRNEQSFHLPGHKYGVLSVMFSADGKILASGGSDGLVRLWRVDDQQLMKTTQVDTGWRPTISGNIAAINHLSFSPDAKLLAAALTDGRIIFLGTEDGRVKETLKAHDSSVLWTLFTPNDRKLISVGQDSTIRVWELK